MVFKRKLLSSSVALAIAGYAAPLMAEEEMGAQNATMEEVVVKGIRGSLQRSMDIKRDASGVVDAISAEEMGKFPDANLAESLQRITGVSISRSRGEGSQVTVRGFGPEYNLVTLNGRQMPTHNGASRSFDFGDLASEGVAGVQVYKTGRADIPTGGVGSTINISMPEPLKRTAPPAFQPRWSKTRRHGLAMTLPLNFPVSILVSLQTTRSASRLPRPTRIETMA